MLTASQSLRVWPVASSTALGSCRPPAGEEGSCTASSASTASQDDYRETRGADLAAFADVVEKRVQPRQLSRRFWQPDAEASTCSMMACNQAFNRFMRRHHCRLCGRVVCATCSRGTRQLLPDSGAGRAANMRVCDACCDHSDSYAMLGTPPLSSSPVTSSLVVQSEPSTPMRLSGLGSVQSSTPLPITRQSSLPLSAPGTATASTDISSHADAEGEDLDEHERTLREKFASTSFYEGLLKHEPAALKLLMRCAADTLRSRDVQVASEVPVDDV